MRLDPGDDVGAAKARLDIGARPAEPHLAALHHRAAADMDGQPPAFLHGRGGEDERGEQGKGKALHRAILAGPVHARNRDSDPGWRRGAALL